MKGIAHFATGLCLASFVPGVIEHSTQGGMLIALGGIAGMMPDVLDFRLERFLEKRDLDIIPTGQPDDAQHMANALAHQMSATLNDGQPRIVQFHPLRRGAADWALYSVEFDELMGNIRIRFDSGESAEAYVGPMIYGYDSPLHIEELGGPCFKFTPQSNAVAIEFLPWHRARTHSLMLAAAFAALAGLLMEPLAGLVVLLGYTGHVLEDQLGYMGSNLFWPFTRVRSRGARLLHAADPAANMFAVWVSLSLLLFNLDRARVAPLLPATSYLLMGVLLPSALMLLAQLRLVLARRRHSQFSGLGDLLHEVADASAS